MKKKICITICLLIFFSCSSETISKKNMNQLGALIKSKNWENVSQIPNNDSSYILIVNQKKATNLIPSPELSYFIYDISKDEIVYEEEMIKGKIKWFDNENLRISLSPGIIKDNEKENVELFGYTINIKTKIKNSNQD